MDDVQGKIGEIVSLVEAARAMPMSASCVVNRADLLGLVDELRALLPGQLRQAEYVLSDRDEVVDEGRREAERIIAAAHVERSRILSDTEIAREARVEAERLVTEAHEQADLMRREVDDYVDTKLANFEVALTKTLAAVERGRDKLRGRQENDALRDPETDETPLPGMT